MRGDMTTCGGQATHFQGVKLGGTSGCLVLRAPALRLLAGQFLIPVVLFDGEGVHTFRPGSCWLQPPGIKHTVLDYSDDCELLEIVMRDKAWNSDLARKTYVAILAVMAKPAPKPAAGEAKGALEVTGKAAAVSADPVLDQYRRKLSMALF